MLEVKADYAFLHRLSGLALPPGLRRDAAVSVDVTVRVVDGCWEGRAWWHWLLHGRLTALVAPSSPCLCSSHLGILAAA
jgi:hypothetical protein